MFQANAVLVSCPSSGSAVHTRRKPSTAAMFVARSGAAALPALPAKPGSDVIERGQSEDQGPADQVDSGEGTLAVSAQVIGDDEARI
jgi:hypothetical protein